MPGTLIERIDQTALQKDQKDAVLFIRKGTVQTRMTYAGLHTNSNRTANGLRKMGLRKGQRVILFMPKSLEEVVFHLAVQKAGAVSVVLNPALKREEMEFFLRDTEATIVVTGKKEEVLIRSIDPTRIVLSIDTDIPFGDDKLFPGVSSQAPSAEGKPGDPALLVYTSGTTGRPKGAILTQQNLTLDADNILQIWEIDAQDVLCHSLPLFHIHGLCFALHTLFIAGGKVVMCDEFSPETVIDILGRREGDMACTIFMGVPTMYSTLMEVLGEERRDFRHIRLLASGSAPLLPRDFERIERAFGKQPVEREGMSETGMNFSNPLRGVKKPGSIGLPLPGVEARIVNPETFVDMGSGKVGELWLKGPNVTPGYWNNPHETEKTFKDGWFRTGDLVRKDEDGYFYITDRLKHIIISGGENISPREIEAILNRHPGVRESCVVGVPDDRWGERVVAAVVSKEGTEMTPGEMRDFCKRYLMDWKCPKELIFLKELPRNKMGKVLKEEVAKCFGKPLLSKTLP